MQLAQMRRQLDQMRRRLARDRRDLDQQQLREFMVNGTIPADELTAAYARLQAAAIKAMDASVSGEDRQDVDDEFEQALAAWNEVNK